LKSLSKKERIKSHTNGACHLMRKANYQQISLTYDAARPISEQNLELWLDLITQKIGSNQIVDFLDLGCGTGRFSIAIVDKLGHSVTGCDISREMLSKAREKEGASNINWIMHDANLSPFVGKSFDAVFMSHLLHHVEKPLNVMRECYRILKPNGIILNRYGAIENIRNDVEHMFFPETLEVDEARVPSINQVEEWFSNAGFESVSSENVLQRTFKSAEEIVERIRLKSTSALTLITQSAFEHGLEALQEHIERNPNDSWLFQDILTLTVGKKSF
jgi:ubiquinone/menaquinone biosynthesis C-methylase UbiE